MTPPQLPVLFLAHGSPMNIVADNSYSRMLKDYAKTIPSPKAVIIISAHWLTRCSFITGSDQPEQMYDFYGFPSELYTVHYKPKGLPILAEHIHKAIPEIAIDPSRGVDHAGWTLMKHLYSDATIPCLEISLDITKTPQQHFDLGKKLAFLRDEGVLIVGGGNLIHNLYDIDFDDEAKPFPWASAIDSWIKEKLVALDIEALVEAADQMPDYDLALPTIEHYLPLLYTLAMRRSEDKLSMLDESIQNGSISMRSFEFR